MQDYLIILRYYLWRELQSNNIDKLQNQNTEALNLAQKRVAQLATNKTGKQTIIF